MSAPQLRQLGAKPNDQEDICLFAQTNFRNRLRRFGIKTDDRRRHMYVIGKTGMGKTTMMENMVLHDIYRGNGVGIIDPHGDFAEKIIDYIPSYRVNDVIYFNPADTDNPIGFNILEVKNDEQKHLIAAGLMGIFKKIWPDAWSSRMEYILNNTLLALLDYPGSTLLGINRLLADKKYRKRVITQLKDPVVRAFWQNEFASYNDRYAQEAVAPIQNKIGQFLSASVIRNIVAQIKSTINIREIMDNKKIFIMNLAKGRIGEDNTRLLGGMLITQIQLAAMERVNIPEKDRKDFFLYVDEFQNFANPSFANILSEARKYRLSLILAHQYIKQLDELVADAVFGNVGTIASFRVGGPDSLELIKEFTPTFIEEDCVNLPKFQIILKLMINGVASHPFSAETMPPIGTPTGSAEKIIRVSRERYAKKKSDIEDKIIRWSGMEGSSDDKDEQDQSRGIARDPDLKSGQDKKENKRFTEQPSKQNTSNKLEKQSEEKKENISLKNLSKATSVNFQKKQNIQPKKNPQPRQSQQRQQPQRQQPQQQPQQQLQQNKSRGIARDPDFTSGQSNPPSCLPAGRRQGFGEARQIKPDFPKPVEVKPVLENSNIEIIKTEDTNKPSQSSDKLEEKQIVHFD